VPSWIWVIVISRQFRSSIACRGAQASTDSAPFCGNPAYSSCRRASSALVDHERLARLAVARRTAQFGASPLTPDVPGLPGAGSSAGRRRGRCGRGRRTKARGGRYAMANRMAALTDLAAQLPAAVSSVRMTATGSGAGRSCWPSRTKTLLSRRVTWLGVMAEIHDVTGPGGRRAATVNPTATLPINVRPVGMPDAARVSTESARGPETTENNRHQPDKQDTRTGRPTRRRRARFGRQAG
jgi:hypothetical protein